MYFYFLCNIIWNFSHFRKISATYCHDCKNVSVILVRALQSSFLQLPRAVDIHVMSARCVPYASAQQVSAAASGQPEMSEIWWNDTHVIFLLLQVFTDHFHLPVSCDFAQLLPLKQIIYVRLKKDNDLCGKKCLSKLKKTHFVECDSCW